MGYRVTALQLVAKTTDERHEIYLSRGAFLPDEVSEDEAKRLVELGLVEDTEAGGKPRKRESAAEKKARLEAEAAEKARLEAEAAEKARLEAEAAAAGGTE